MATRLAGAVHQADLRCLCILFVAFLSEFPIKAPAEISPQAYVLKGEMLYSFLRDGKEEYTEKRTCEIYRNGDKLKISTSLYSSNFPATVFVCDRNTAFTYVQYADTSVPKSKKSWNNADVWLSTYRMPKYSLGKLTPLWLMVQGNDEFLRRNDSSWISVYGNGRSFEFDPQSKTIPETSSESFWPMGFSHYIEIIETKYSRSTVVQECEFRIQTWTNYSGSNFPQSFISTIKKTNKGKPALISETRYAFTTTGIEVASKTAFETNAPIFSRVIDMRPRELGQSPSGILYKSPEGIIYSDPLEEKEKGLGIRIAKGGAPASPPKPSKPTSLKPLIIIISFLAFFPGLFLLKRRFLKSAKSP